MGDSDVFERPVREKRPEFSPEEPIAERLVRVAMNLAAELAVVRERLDTVERLLAERGQVTAADIEGYRPDETTEAERRAWRETYVRRIFADLEGELAAARRELDASRSD